MTPFWEASRGLNHIDGRLEPSSNYGVLGPLFRAHPPDPRSGVWGPDPGSGGAVFYLGDAVKHRTFPGTPDLGSQGSGVPGTPDMGSMGLPIKPTTLYLGMLQML